MSLIPTGHPLFTRLRYIKSKDADLLTQWSNRLTYRIDVYEIVWHPTEKIWYLWYVPSDEARKVEPNRQI